MKTVVYSCPFVPAEWIQAHGFQPLRLVAGEAKGAPLEGLCPYADSFLHAAMATQPAAIVFTTVCDQMRRVVERVSDEIPTFLMHVPATWQTAGPHKFYRSELDRLGRFLLSLGGQSPTAVHLVAILQDYDAKRAELRGLRGQVSSRCFAETLAAFHCSGEVSVAEDVRPEPQGVPLALVGGPFPRDAFVLLDEVRACGGEVVLDGTESGERTLPAAFDRRRLQDDPVGELVDAYFGTIPDISQRPNNRFFQWLRRETRARGVRGLIVRRYVWCDPWHAEVERLREWASVPVLAIDVESTAAAGVLSRTRTRIQAFMETLR